MASESGDQSWATLVGSEWSHHCAVPAPTTCDSGIRSCEEAGILWGSRDSAVMTALIAIHCCLLLVLVPAPRVFLGVLRFPRFLKTNISKFQFDLNDFQALYHEPLAREIAQALPVLLTLNKLLYFTLVRS